MKETFRLLALCAFLPAAVHAAGGVAYVSDTINWSQTPDLYFSVAGAPPNTCGAFVSTRNGQYLFSPGWICTDANGNATKGPWTWAGTPGDQKDDNAYIQWTDGTKTNTFDHWWDKTCPVLNRANVTGAPPASWSGTASDNRYGAGFHPNWTRIYTVFEDRTTGLRWLPGQAGYDASSGEVDATFSGQYSTFGSWSNPQIPPSGAHVAGRTYAWTTCMTDGDVLCSPTCLAPYVFTR